MAECIGWTVRLSGPTRVELTAEQALDLGQPLTAVGHDAAPVLAFVMSRDLAGAHVTATDVLGATSSVAVGIECIDAVDSGRFVLAAPVPATGIDLRLIGVVLEHNGDVVATASGAAALGHPAASVAWLVRSLAGTGDGLRAGQLVLSGRLTAGVPIAAGDVVVASIDRIGSVELPVR
jgi:2-oxo-3-hexenedioate decarboxylase